MRLTNVAQMRLPDGRLWSLSTSVSGVRGRELPISFDQRRHVGEGDRAGSWMAVSFRLSEPVDRERLSDAWLRVVARHGSLHSVFTRDEAGELRLYDTPVTARGWVEHDREGDEANRDILRRICDEQCRPFSAPSHQLCLIEPACEEADQRPVAVIASDHAHVDMWSMLVLARDLGSALTGDAPLADASSFSDHTTQLIDQPSAPDHVRDEWTRLLASGGGFMPCFPLDLGDISSPSAEVVEIRDVLDASGRERFEIAAASEGVRPVAAALACMTRVTREISGQPLRAVFPVHSRSGLQWSEAVGWFITNSVIECDDSSLASCAAAVKRAIDLGAYSLEPILRPYGGMPQAPGMFALSWLDGRKLPRGAIVPELSTISAVIRTDGVMVWFVIDDTGLHLRCRYPDTPEARAHVGMWLNRVVDEFRSTATLKAG